jgi:hypothetical protein
MIINVWGKWRSSFFFKWWWWIDRTQSATAKRRASPDFYFLVDTRPFAVTLSLSFIFIFFHHCHLYSVFRAIWWSDIRYVWHFLLDALDGFSSGSSNTTSFNCRRLCCTVLSTVARWPLCHQVALSGCRIPNFQVSNWRVGLPHTTENRQHVSD